MLNLDINTMINNYAQKLLTTTLALVLIAGMSASAFAAEDGRTATSDTPTLPVSTSVAANIIDFATCVDASSTSYSEDGATVTMVGGATIRCFGDPNTTVGVWEDFSVLRADLGCTTNSVSIDLGDFNGDDDNMYVEAYTSGNVLVDSDTSFIPFTFTGMNTLTVTGSNIAYILTGSSGSFPTPNTVFVDNIAFTCDATVAGELLPLNTTALFISGITSSAIWMIPTLAGIAGAGVYFIRSRTHEEN